MINKLLMKKLFNQRLNAYETNPFEFGTNSNLIKTICKSQKKS